MLFWDNILHGLRPTGQPRLQSQGPLWYDWYIYDHGTALIKYIINIRGLISFNQTIPLVKMESSSNIFQRPGVQMHGWQTTIITITVIIIKHQTWYANGGDLDIPLMIWSLISEYPLPSTDNFCYRDFAIFLTISSLFSRIDARFLITDSFSAQNCASTV